MQDFVRKIMICTAQKSALFVTLCAIICQSILDNALGFSYISSFCFSFTASYFI